MNTGAKLIKVFDKILSDIDIDICDQIKTRVSISYILASMVEKVEFFKLERKYLESQQFRKHVSKRCKRFGLSPNYIELGIELTPNIIESLYELSDSINIANIAEYVVIINRYIQYGINFINSLVLTQELKDNITSILHIISANIDCINRHTLVEFCKSIVLFIQQLV